MESDPSIGPSRADRHGASAGAPARHVPEEIARFDPVLMEAAREVQLLGAVTPIDASSERARLAAAFESGRDITPGWIYPRAIRTSVRRGLDAVDRELAHEPPTPLVALYRARARELALEAAIAEAAGTPRLAPLAKRRFGAFAERTAKRAAELGAQWARIAPRSASPTLASDGRDPRSLLSRMRAEVDRLRLPYRIVVTDVLAPLAATGEHTIWVVAAREVTEEDVERTVLHELQGHALPRVRGRKLAPVFTFGTARGSDEQEGLALVLEERRGFLGAGRRRELGLRHEVAERMWGGASFADSVRWLVGEGGASVPSAVRLAERVYRGSDGRGPGLGRERVYLESFVRVREHLRDHPGDELVLASGQVALEAVSALGPYCEKHTFCAAF